MIDRFVVTVLSKFSLTFKLFKGEGVVSDVFIFVLYYFMCRYTCT